MKLTKKSGYDLLLLLAAMIWGFAFVAQRAGMEHIGPFLFNAFRFLIGGVILLPFIYFQKSNKVSFKDFTKNCKGGLFAGLLLFGGASMQQIGIVNTTAGKAGFITGLYVVLVPIFGLMFKRKTPINVWVGAIFAVVGLYFLTVTDNFTILIGDIFVLVSAIIWAFHVLIIAKYAPTGNAIIISVFQFILCGFLSLVFAMVFEEIVLLNILEATIPILYGGLLSVAVAFTLQVIAQKHAHPSLAAIILSLESVFAVFGGWLLLDEIMNFKSITGCFLMLIGMIIAQLKIDTKNFKQKNVTLYSEK